MSAVESCLDPEETVEYREGGSKLALSSSPAWPVSHSLEDGKVWPTAQSELSPCNGQVKKVMSAAKCENM